jgi:hypothetical protein
MADEGKKAKHKSVKMCATPHYGKKRKLSFFFEPQKYSSPVQL